MDITMVVYFSIGGITGWFVRTIFDHYCARSRGLESIQIVEFNKGAAEFRSAFTDIIQKLRAIPVNADDIEADKVFDAKYIRDSLDSAQITFEPFLNRREIARFRKAWNNFKDRKEKYKNRSNYNGIKLAEFYLIEIDNILKFAKPKP